jgi:hypothetical protein
MKTYTIQLSEYQLKLLQKSIIFDLDVNDDDLEEMELIGDMITTILVEEETDTIHCFNL